MKKDANHKPIADGLTEAGKVVFDVSALPGLGFDVVVYDPVSDRWFPMEIKAPRYKNMSAAAKAKQLKPSQVRALAQAPIPVIETLEQALAHLLVRV